MPTIIGISGKKQSGKNTAANYITGSILKSIDMVQDFSINNQGQLEIKTTNAGGAVGWGIFDATRKDIQFLRYASQELWPYTKIYHFADYLKQICVDLFDLSPEQVYGTDEDKNTKTKIRKQKSRTNMTAREFLQFFGTDVMRKIKDSIWVDYTIKLIQQEQSAVSIIPDVRFPNEVMAIKKAGGCIIRLDRNVHCSDHKCEKALDQENFSWDEFDYIIKNNDLDISQLCNHLESIQKLWGISC